ncbi:hypothetical protein MMPV_002901 [Pyropia vietnamensis]
MGVPAFFRWLSMKYPRILHDCVECVRWDTKTGKPLPIDALGPNPNGVEYDNLYLDMNGIIHPCTHPEDKPAPTTEVAMFEDVCAYVDRLVGIVRPRKLIYLAVDGVAPRAKINQQRSRRFRSAREAAEAAAEAAELRKEFKAAGLLAPEEATASNAGSPAEQSRAAATSSAGNAGVDEVANTGDSFDSNVITPGTPFMCRLAVALRKHVAVRMAEGGIWSSLRVILSDASVPGEGEHKIAQFIRVQRTQPGYDPAVRHVLYGLDADLIMLALATHEQYFTVLRELVFPPARGPPGGRGGPSAATTDAVSLKSKLSEASVMGTDVLEGTLAELGGMKPFQWLHVHTLREYLDYEFKADISDGLRRLADPGGVVYDLERAIDDFVFLCFFVGNDFLPHLPTLDIREGAIDFLMELYKGLVPTLGYLTDGTGDVDFAKVRVLLADVGRKEDQVFAKRMESEARARQRDREEKARAAALEAATTIAATMPLPDSPASGGKQNKKRRTRDEATASPTAAAAGEAKGSANKASSKDPGPPPTSDDDMIPLGRDNIKPDKKKKVMADSFSVANSLRVNLSDIAKPASNHVPLAPDADFSEELKKRLRSKGDMGDLPDNVRLGEAGWKARYYSTKFGWSEKDIGPMAALVRSYYEGLLWVMHYYYRGCSSWEWYFPYHYAPFASDLVGVDVLSDNIHFSLGRPFRPFTQLMGVMPASSGKLVLPRCYSRLMSSLTSPILEYYPEDFEIDLNGKRFAWQGVALLPFVDEKRLHAALDPLAPLLTAEEVARNSFGRPRLLAHSSSALGVALLQIKASLESDVATPGVDVEMIEPVPATDAPVKGSDGEAPTVSVPSTDTPPATVSAGDTPAVGAADTKAPSSGAPAAELSVTAAPVVASPAGQAPASKVPAGKGPATEVPVSAAPTAETPAGEKLPSTPAAMTLGGVTDASTPAAETPAAETPAAETPAAVAPSAVTADAGMSGVETCAVEAPAAGATTAEAPAAKSVANKAPALDAAAVNALAMKVPAAEKSTAVARVDQALAVDAKPMKIANEKNDFDEEAEGAGEGPLVAIPEVATASMCFGSVRCVSLLPPQAVEAEYTLPRTAGHIPRLLPGAEGGPPKTLTGSDLAEVARAGWRPAKFGTLGKAAETLARERRSGVVGGRRGGGGAGGGGAGGGGAGGGGAGGGGGGRRSSRGSRGHGSGVIHELGSGSYAGPRAGSYSGGGNVAVGAAAPSPYSQFAAQSQHARQSGGYGGPGAYGAQPQQSQQGGYGGGGDSQYYGGGSSSYGRGGSGYSGQGGSGGYGGSGYDGGSGGGYYGSQQQRGWGGGYNSFFGGQQGQRGGQQAPSSVYNGYVGGGYGQQQQQGGGYGGQQQSYGHGQQGFGQSSYGHQPYGQQSGYSGGSYGQAPPYYQGGGSGGVSGGGAYGGGGGGYRGGHGGGGGDTGSAWGGYGYDSYGSAPVVGRGSSLAGPTAELLRRGRGRGGRGGQ